MQKRTKLKTSLKNWLAEDALPLWLKNGFDATTGRFYEALDINTGEPRIGPRRAMVQCRQIYSVRTAWRMGLLDGKSAKDIISAASASFLRDFSTPTGAFRHSLHHDGGTAQETPDLYAQAFGIFGLASAYEVTKEHRWKSAALENIHYLRSERCAPAGGYTELSTSGVSYESNPHMHLFEAALAWVEADFDPAWTGLADDLLQMCQINFIDPVTGLLAEHFNETWQPLRTGGAFVFEPGHQYEWSWLMGRHQAMRGGDLRAIRQHLFRLSELHGLDRDRGMVLDQVNSNLQPKLLSSRFWPQCERIKAAKQLARETSNADEREGFETAADQGAQALMVFLETPVRGLWRDTMTDAGDLIVQPAKASSLYHIICAIQEYVAD